MSNGIRKRNAIALYTDGSCMNKPGRLGGWAAVIVYPKGGVKTITGVACHTTSNRMELTAVIEGIRSIGKTKKSICVYSDSMYVVKTMRDGWLEKWARAGWLRADGSPVKNKDLWEQLLQVTDGLKIRFVHVKGHSGDTFNELADELARSAYRN